MTTKVSFTIEQRNAVVDHVMKTYYRRRSRTVLENVEELRQVAHRAIQTVVPRMDPARGDPRALAWRAAHGEVGRFAVQYLRTVVSLPQKGNDRERLAQAAAVSLSTPDVGRRIRRLAEPGPSPEQVAGDLQLRRRVRQELRLLAACHLLPRRAPEALLGEISEEDLAREARIKPAAARLAVRKLREEAAGSPELRDLWRAL